MRRPGTVVIASLFFLLSGANVFAQDRRDDGDVFEDDGRRYPGWLCEVCQTPGDFAAFAFNAYWSKEAWAHGSTLGVPFRVYNLDGDWVVIWFTDFLFDVPSLLPATLIVKVWQRSGSIASIEMKKDGPPLAIGGSSTGAASGSGAGAGTGGASAPVVTSSPTGVVTIVDPGEDGTFPAWDYEK